MKQKHCQIHGILRFLKVSCETTEVSTLEWFGFIVPKFAKCKCPASCNFQKISWVCCTGEIFFQTKKIAPNISWYNNVSVLKSTVTVVVKFWYDKYVFVTLLNLCYKTMYFTILQLVIELPFYGPFETWKKQQKKKKWGREEVWL